MAVRTNIRITRVLKALAFAGLVVPAAFAQEEVIELSKLSFQEFERIAIAADPIASKFRNRASAMRDRGMSMSQLPDPSVQLGLMNLPTDSFAFDREPMTQKIIGFQQMFPAYGLLDNKKAEMDSRARAEDGMAEDRQLMVLQGVRESWLELYYQFQAEALIKQTEKIFNELVQITQFRYRAGRGTQHDMIRAELELSMLQERVAQIETQKDVVLAQLGNWIGAAHVERPAPVRFPVLPPLPSQDEIRSKINAHPSIVAAQSRVSASRATVEQARAQYRPQTMLQLTYGLRDYEDMADTFSGMVSFSLPIFTGKRQDRALQASRAEVEEGKDAVEEQRRKLYEMVESGYRRWNRLDERYRHFEQEVLPFAAQYSQTTLSSYQSGVTDFSVQIRARVQELEQGLMALRLQVDRSKEHAKLLYLAGDSTL